LRGSREPAHDFTVRIVVAFAAALLAIGAVTAASLRSLSARRDWSRWIVHTQGRRGSGEVNGESETMATGLPAA